LPTETRCIDTSQYSGYFFSPQLNPQIIQPVFSCHYRSRPAPSEWIETQTTTDRRKTVQNVSRYGGIKDTFGDPGSIRAPVILFSSTCTQFRTIANQSF